MTELTLERAKEINKRCFEHVMYREGVRDTAPASLEEYSLEEMVKAASVIKEAEAVEREAKPNGPWATLAKYDDRLIAALYTMTHYQSSPPDDPHVIVSDAKKVLVVCEMPDLEGHDDQN